MKTVLSLSIFSLIISFSSFAQPTRGTYFVGGSVSGSFDKSPTQAYESKRYHFAISPNVGKFISEKYQLNFGLAYMIQNNQLQGLTDQLYRQTVQTFSASFGVTRYFPLTEKLYFNLSASITPRYSNTSGYTNINYWSESNSLETYAGSLSVSPGLTYFLNNKWLLYSYIGGLNYSVTMYDFTDQLGHEMNINFAANSFGIGARFLLGQGTK